MHKCNVHYEAMPDGITDFEICVFQKNTKILQWILHIKGYFIAKKSFIAEVPLTPEIES